MAVVARAFLIALVGFVVASGAAFAHGGLKAAADGRAHERVTAAEPYAHEIQLTKAMTSWAASQQTDPSGEPCSEEQPGGHVGGGCCHVACHGALAAPTVEPPGSRVSVSRDPASLSGMLVGRPNDCAERPPKRA